MKTPDLPFGESGVLLARKTKETLIQSQNSISHIFSYNASSEPSLNSSLFKEGSSLRYMKIQE